MRRIAVPILTFLLGIVATTALTAHAGSGYFVPIENPTAFTGYTYDAAKGRAEVRVDDFIPDCAGKEVTVTISANRSEASVGCQFSPAAPSYMRTSPLPVFQANPEFAVVWTR